MKSFVAALALSVFAATAALAQPDIRTVAPGQAPPAAVIADVAWLEGRWVGEGLGGTTEETYGAPAGGQMMGHFRLVRDGKPVFYEFMLVRERGGSLVYTLKHFNPDGGAWEEKERWVEFPLVAIEGDTAYFSGLTLAREGRDGLAAHLRLKKRDTGETWIETFRFRRVR